jgi:hypothetical protein
VDLWLYHLVSIMDYTKEVIVIAMTPRLAKAALCVALVVGTILNLIN